MKVFIDATDGKKTVACLSTNINAIFLTVRSASSSSWSSSPGFRVSESLQSARTICSVASGSVLPDMAAYFIWRIALPVLAVPKYCNGVEIHVGSLAIESIVPPICIDHSGHTPKTTERSCYSHCLRIVAECDASVCSWECPSQCFQNLWFGGSWTSHPAKNFLIGTGRSRKMTPGMHTETMTCHAGPTGL